MIELYLGVGFFIGFASMAAAAIESGAELRLDKDGLLSLALLWALTALFWPAVVFFVSLWCADKIIELFR